MEDLFANHRVQREVGLSSLEVTARRAVYGSNAPAAPKKEAEFFKWARNLCEPLLLLLVLAAVLAFVSYALDGGSENVILAGTLIAVVILGATLSYAAQAEASKIVDAIKNLLPLECRVLRDGVEVRLPTASLVPGDICHLTTGCKVPADCVLFSCSDLRVDVQMVTGESEPVEGCVERRSDAPVEARNLLFCSSLVCAGEGWGVVVCTGGNTLVGCISTEAHKKDAVPTLLDREVRRVIAFISILSIATAVVFLVIGLSRGLGVGFSITQAFILTLVANVPEGLPTTITLVLTLCAKRCATQHKVLIKDISIMLTLGGISVLCSDKTGTLTQGKMKVSSLWLSSGTVVEGTHTHEQRLQLPPVSRVMAIGRQLSLIRSASASGGGSGSGGAHSAIIHSTALAALGPTNPSATTDPHTGHALGPGAPLDRVHEALAAAHSAPDPAPAPPPTSSATATAGAPTTATTPSPLAGGAQPQGRPSALSSPPPSAPGAAPASLLVRSTSLQLARARRPHILKIGEGGAVLRGHSFVVPRGSPRPAATAATTSSSRASSSIARWAAPPPPPSATAPTAPPTSSAGAAGEAPSTAPSAGGAAGAPPPATPLQNSWGSGTNAFTRLCCIAVCANRAVVSEGGGGAAASALGDASDVALLTFAQGLSSSVAAWRAGFPVLHATPFSSLTKMSSVTVGAPASGGGTGGTGGGSPLFFLKGAPERVLETCSHRLCEGGFPCTTTTEIPIDEEWRAHWHAQYEIFGCAGERVLGFAYRQLAAGEGVQGTASGSNVFCGLISLADPPKPQAAEAVRRCHAAGIRVTMITGDHPLTAEAIARKLGIISLRTAREVAAEDGVGEGEVSPQDARVGAVVLTGHELAAMAPAALDALLVRTPQVVFARTSPEQKCSIVEAYQRGGHCVGMTGDGTNDACALKRADVGVAMGSSAASDVAREVADCIILNDDIGALTKAIEAGRGAFFTIRKVIAYTVAHAVPELVPSFCNLVFDVPLMLPSLLILVVDLLTEQLPAVSLTYDPPEADIMLQPPRNLLRERLIDAPLLVYSYVLVALLESLTCVGAFFLFLAFKGFPIGALLYNRAFWEGASGEALGALRGGVSSYFWTLALCQAGVHIYVVKTLRVSLADYPWWANRLTNLGVLVAAGVCVLFIYPLQGRLFGTGNMSFWVSWVLFLLFGLLFVPIMELFKWASRRKYLNFP